MNIIEAAKSGDLEEVKLLIASGADVNAKDDSGNTALILAARYGEGKMAKLLKSKGAV